VSAGSSSVGGRNNNNNNINSSHHYSPSPLITNKTLHPPSSPPPRYRNSIHNTLDMIRPMKQSGLMNVNHQRAALGLGGPNSNNNLTNHNNNNNGRGNMNNTSNNPTQSFSEQSRQLMEEQNDAAIAELGEKVGLMKNLAVDIEEGIAKDKILLDNMSGSFENVTNMMKGTLGNVQKMLATGGSKHMCYLVLFILAVFFVLYFLMKR
jgi:blocked-early-in-transport protein 1